MATILGKDKRKVLVVIDDQNTKQVLPETSADQVTLEKVDGLTATNVQGAFDEILSVAGKVDDVVNADGTSIVDDKKIAQLKNAVVKEAGKVTNALEIIAHNGNAGTRTVSFDGSLDPQVDFDVNDFTAESIEKGMKISLVDKGYATKTYVDAQDNKKLDKAGGAVTGDLTIGGNLTVSGTTTTVDSTTLQVKDKLIEVAHGNTEKLTTPAGLVAPKYDGTNSGALVFDGDGIASVGDVVFDAAGNIDVAKSDLQPLATRAGLVDGSLVKYDGTNKTLVPVNTGDQIDEFIKFSNASGIGLDEIHTLGGEQIFKEDTENAKYEIGTASRDVKLVGKSAHPQYLGYGETDPQNIVLETDVVHVAERSYSADKTKGTLKLVGQNSIGAEETDSFNGSENKELSFNPTDFTAIKTSNSYDVELSTVYTKPDLSQTIAGTYTAVMVNQKGVVQAGNRAFAFIDAGAAIPSDVMIGGFIFEATE